MGLIFGQYIILLQTIQMGVLEEMHQETLRFHPEFQREVGTISLGIAYLQITFLTPHMREIQLGQEQITHSW